MNIEVSETHVNIRIERSLLPEVYIEHNQRTGRVVSVQATGFPSAAYAPIYSPSFQSMIYGLVASHLGFAEAEDRTVSDLRSTLSGIIAETDGDPSRSAEIVAQALMEAGVYRISKVEEF